MAILVQEPPLVGRREELKILEECLVDAASGKGSVVLVAGEAGIGKTSLLEMFGKMAAEKGVLILVGRCIPAATSPYEPFQDALNKIPKQSVKELGLKEWLRGIRTVEPPVYKSAVLGKATELQNGSTLYMALEFFRELSRKHVSVVMLEDLHWADSASIQLLHFLARNCKDLRILIIGSYRPEDITADTKTGIPLLLDSIRVMRREGVVRDLDLDRLTPEELKVAVEAMLGGHIDNELLRRITDESQGNPLYGVEITRLLVQTKSITIERGYWKAVGKLKIEIPTTVSEVILRRVERLPREERRVVESAAIIGERFDPEILGEVLGIERLSLLETLDSIQRGSQLVRAFDNSYSFSHEKIQQVVYYHVSSLRRRELHKKVAQILETRVPDENLGGELSTHFYLGGEVEKCIRYSLSAGRHSLAKFALREAVEYFQRVIELARDGSSFLKERLLSLEGLADCNRRLGFRDQALTQYKMSLELAHVPSDRIRILRKLAASFVDTFRDFSIAIQLLDEAEKYEDIDVVEAARMKNLRGIIAYETGAQKDAEMFYSEARKLLEQSGPSEDLARVLGDQATIFLASGRVEEALEELKRADEIFRNLGNPGGEIESLLNLGDAYFHIGMVEEALRSYGKCEEIASKFGLLHYYTHIWKAMLYYSIDDFEHGKMEAERGVDYCLTIGNVYWGAVGNTVLAMTQTRLNRILEAENALAEAVRLAESVSSQDRSPMRPYLAIAEAELHAAKREWASCTTKFQEAIQDLKSSGYDLLFEALARTSFGRALAKHGLAQQAQLEFDQAIQLYEKLGNAPQTKRVRLMALGPETLPGAS